MNPQMSVVAIVASLLAIAVSDMAASSCSCTLFSFSVFCLKFAIRKPSIDLYIYCDIFRGKTPYAKSKKDDHEFLAKRLVVSYNIM